MTGKKSEGKTAFKYPPARILGIETSCDETAAAIVENGRAMLSNVVATQMELHAKYGGVFPEMASRQHIRTIYAVLEQALQQAHLTITDIDAIAVTGNSLEKYTAEAYISALYELACELRPDLIIIPHSPSGYDYAPQVAVKLNAACNLLS